MREINEFILLCSKASCSIVNSFITFPIVFYIQDILKIIGFHNVFISIYASMFQYINWRNTDSTLRTRVCYHTVTDIYCLTSDVLLGLTVMDVRISRYDVHRSDTSRLDPESDWSTMLVTLHKSIYVLLC